MQTWDSRLPGIRTHASFKNCVFGDDRCRHLDSSVIFYFDGIYELKEISEIDAKIIRYSDGKSVKPFADAEIARRRIFLLPL